MNQVFDFNRTLLYSKLKFNLNKKFLFLSLGGFFGILFVISFIIAANIPTGNVEPLFIFHTVAFVIMLFLGCIIVAGRSFQDMNTSEKALSQIMIPASGFEKFITTVLFSSVGWILITFISYEIFALLTNAIWAGIFGLDYKTFNVFDLPEMPADSIKYTLYFFFGIHSLFFLGASAFKKYPIAKTALAGFLVNQAFSLLFLVTILITFGSLLEFGEAMGNIVDHLQAIDLELEDIEKYFIYPEILFAYILPATLYVAAYFKLKEREV